MIDSELHRSLSDLLLQLRDQTKENWNRTLPIGDYLSNRWEKARFLGFGEGASVYDSCLVMGEVKVGRDTWIGPFSVLDGTGGGLIIGDHCSISAGVQIYTHDTVEWAVNSGEIARAPVKIGNNCFIGPNVIISKGVTIGDHVVIGANSFVNGDISSYKKAWGTPCRVVGDVTRKEPSLKQAF